MSIIFLIVPVTLLLSAGAVAAFAWATRSGQFDDLETPAIRLLHEDNTRPPGAREPASIDESRE
ncbi:MAG: cbb3-type cytochrome oxidase assembly protein CcoS [Pseudomonadota bacterium]